MINPPALAKTSTEKKIKDSKEVFERITIYYDILPETNKI